MILFKVVATVMIINAGFNIADDMDFEAGAILIASIPAIMAFYAVWH